MKRIATACALAGLLGLPGCAEEQESIVVLGAVAWSVDAVDGSCIADPANEAYLSYGVLDMYCLGAGAQCELSTSYVVPTVLQSQLPPRDPGISNSGTDPNELQLREVEVSYSMPQAPDVIDDLKRVDTSLVHFNAPLATDSFAAGQAKGVIVEAISAVQAAALFGAITGRLGEEFTEVTLVVSMRFYAERSGNTAGNIGEVESRDFQFPIKLCVGCLQTCSPCEMGQCPGIPADLVWGGGVCGNAQDGPIFPTGCGM